jgi:hypothetical protein
LLLSGIKAYLGKPFSTENPFSYPYEPVGAMDYSIPAYSRNAFAVCCVASRELKLA